MHESDNFRTIAESVPDSILVCSAGALVWCNRAAKKLFGLKSTADGTDIGKLFTGSASIFQPHEPSPLQEGGAIVIEAVAVTANGDISVEVVRNQIDFNGVPSSLLVVRNISRQKETEHELLSIAFEFQGLFETFPDLYFKLDSQGVIVDAKAGRLQSFYLPPIEFINKKVTDVLPYEASRKIVEAISTVVTEGKGSSVFYTLPYPDGEKHFEARFLPLPGGFTGTFVRDMTDLKDAEQRLVDSEKFLESIFDNIQDGISVLDCDLNIIRANRTIEKWVPEAMPLAGKKCYEAYHNFSSPCEHCPSIRALRTGKISSEIFERKTEGKNKSTWFELYAFPLTDYATGKPRGVIEYLRDITARRIAEAELLKNTERMEKLIEKRTAELNRAYDKLLSSERLAVLGQFAGGIAHEIRNPLNVISTAVFYLKRKLLQGNEKACEYMDKIQKQVEACNGIIESILRLTQIQPPMLRHTNLCEFLSNAVDEKKLPKDVTLKMALPEYPVYSMIDTDQINLVVANIIKNATQAMPDGGAITCSLESIETADGEHECAISITDTGAGISKENVEKIFEPLFTTKTHGIGFGLSIVRAVMEKHDGRIEVESEPDKGTTFKLVLKESKTEE